MLPEITKECEGPQWTAHRQTSEGNDKILKDYEVIPCAKNVPSDAKSVGDATKSHRRTNKTKFDSPTRE